MGHIIINPVPALSRAVLVDQAWFDPVYVQSSGSGGIRTHNLLLQYQRRELTTTAPPRPDMIFFSEFLCIIF